MHKEQFQGNRMNMAQIRLLATVFVIALLAGLSGESGRAGSVMQSTQALSISGTVSMAGSTSMESLANALAEGFMNRYPQVTVTAEFTGSSAGIAAVLTGSVDIANSSRQLYPEERAAGVVEHVVALDGIVIITDKKNPVRELTKEQLGGIYQGKIRNWCEVGGRDEAVVVVGREAGSGTREAFEIFLGMGDGCVYANELNSTGAVVARVASTPGAIGYVSLEVVDDSVSVLALDGIMPGEDTVRSGRYRLYRPYVMVTRGGIEEQSEAVQAFFGYLHSGEGEALLKRIGVILPD